jgi:hypothetical protein
MGTGADLPAWDECVTEVKAVVAQRVAQLDPRYFDPAAGERPENPDSPWSFETVSD